MLALGFSFSLPNITHTLHHSNTKYTQTFFTYFLTHRYTVHLQAMPSVKVVQKWKMGQTLTSISNKMGPKWQNCKNGEK